MLYKQEMGAIPPGGGLVPGVKGEKMTEEELQAKRERMIRNKARLEEEQKKSKGKPRGREVQIEAIGKSIEELDRYLGPRAEEADKKKRDSVDARNQADTLLHSTEKNLKEHGSKVSDTDKKEIETAAANLRNALKGTDVEEIKKNIQELVQKSMKLGEAIYKSQQSTKPDEASKDKEEGKKDDNVVDADFEEVKEDNKEKSA